MPYSHPYKPNPEPGRPYDAPGRERHAPPQTARFDARADDLGRRMDEKAAELDRRAEEWSRRAEEWGRRVDRKAEKLDHSVDDFVDNVAELGANIGSGVLGAISDALASAGSAISRWARPDRELTFAQWRDRLDRRLQNSEQGGCLVMAILGGLLTASFGITALLMLVLCAMGPEGLGVTRDTFNVFPAMLAVFTPLTAGFGIMTGVGVKKYRFFGRIRGYLRAAHDWVASLPAIARATGYGAAQVRSELTKAIADGKLPGVFLGDDGDTIYFKEELLLADQARKQRADAACSRAQAKAQQKASAAPLTPLEQFQRDGSDFLQYLNGCRGRLDAAADEELAAMHKNCAAILGFVHNHPDQLPRVRRFSEYYLPTTRKLLDTALGLGDAEAESARVIRRDITGILHTLNAAYVKLYDTLLQDVSLDVSTEIDTLEAMLRQDGLAGGFASDFGASAPQ